MARLAVEHLSFAYPGSGQQVLRDLSFTVEPGEFVLLCGPSGCGKTTLLRQFQPALAPRGSLQGRVLADGVPLTQWPARRLAQTIGFVQQDPDGQIVTDKVWHELAFGLENLGYASDVIRRRVAEMASYFGIAGWFHRPVDTLSGGQKQILNLAAAMTLRPEILILDEPTAQLDPIASTRFLEAVGRIHRELGATILLTEHRLEEAFSLAQRVLVLEGGALRFDGPPRQTAAALQQWGHALAEALPTPMRVWASAPHEAPCPITVAEGRRWLQGFAARHPLGQVAPDPPPARADWAVQLDQVWFRYEKTDPDLIRGLCLSIPRGSLFALLGGNGAGKTTTLHLMAGVQKPQRGSVRVFGRTGLLPQKPVSLFLQKTVGEDLRETARCVPDGAARLEELVRLCRLQALLEQNPYDLSGGEQQRAGLCKILLLQPEILLLDEPTKGLDVGFQKELASILQQLCRSAVTVVLVSHDLEFCARYATCCALLFDGAATGQAPPRAFFRENRFYTTAAGRMAQPLLPDAVTAEDLICACGGAQFKPCVQSAEPVEERTIPKPDLPAPAEKRTSRPWPAWALAAAMPLTLLAGSALLDNRRPLVISLLLLLEILALALVHLEGRRPPARTLALLAVLCALAVLGRTALFMLPQLKPLLAIVILTGMAFGASAGFLVGAASMLVSDMLMGLGPWTPYQMVAAGLVGALAGALCRIGVLRPSRVCMCVYGALATVGIYGGILNPASVLLYQPNPTAAMIWAAYVGGLPFDLLHAASTVCVLGLIGPLVLDKLARIRQKYDL